MTPELLIAILYFLGVLLIDYGIPIVQVASIVYLVVEIVGVSERTKRIERILRNKCG